MKNNIYDILKVYESSLNEDESIEYIRQVETKILQLRMKLRNFEPSYDHGRYSNLGQLPQVYYNFILWGYIYYVYIPNEQIKDVITSIITTGFRFFNEKDKELKDKLFKIN